MTKLLDLPPELIQRISEAMCYHCRNPKHFVNRDEEDTKTDKHSLAKLCLTSRALRNLAQPILYHYYATGNAVTIHHNGIEHNTHRRGRVQSDKLPLFLRTIIERPELGTMIRSLQLFPSTDTETLTLELYIFFHHHVPQIRLPFLLTSACDCYETEDWNWDPAVTGTMTTAAAKTAVESACYHKQKILHWWMIGIAILKTAAALESLLTAEGFPLPLISRDLELTFPRLRRLLLQGEVQTGATLDKLPDLQKVDFGIEELCIDFRRMPSDSWRDSIWLNNRNPMANLKKLFCIDFTPHCLEKFLANCPVLEDLECYTLAWNPLAIYFEDWAPSKYTAAFREVKKTLRRLCFARIPGTSNQDLRDILEEDDKCLSTLEARHNHEPMEPFDDFEVLHDLTLDQQSFHRPPRIVKNGAQSSSSLVSLLPPNIKQFQILYAFNNMENGLVSLAHSIRHGSFPDLHTVRLSLLHQIGYNRTHTFEWIEEARTELEVEGVQFIHEVRRNWHDTDESLRGSGRDTRGCEPLTIIPGATVGSRYVACEWSESWRWCTHAEWAEPTGRTEEHYECEYHLLQTGKSPSDCGCCDDIAVADDSD